MIKSTPIRLTAGFDIGPGFGHDEAPIKTVDAQSTTRPNQTMVQQLRWEPVLRGSSWHTVPDTVRKQMLTLAARDPLASELEALIKGATNDQVLDVTWAEAPAGGTTPQVIGWAVANIWETVRSPEGVFVVFLHPDFQVEKVHESLVKQMVLNFDRDITHTQFHVSKRDDLLVTQLREQGCETVNAVLP